MQQNSYPSFCSRLLLSSLSGWLMRVERNVMQTLIVNHSVVAGD